MPRQRHQKLSLIFIRAVVPVPLTRHNFRGSPFQGCSQKALATLATLFSR